MAGLQGNGKCVCVRACMCACMRVRVCVCVVVCRHHVTGQHVLTSRFCSCFNLFVGNHFM